MVVSTTTGTTVLAVYFLNARDRVDLICGATVREGRKAVWSGANQTLRDRPSTGEMRLKESAALKQRTPGLLIADSNRRSFRRPAKYPKDLHRPVAESVAKTGWIYLHGRIGITISLLTYSM